MPTRKRKKKVEEPVDPLEDLREEKKIENKDHRVVEKFVLDRLGVPKNLVKVETLHYNWGEGKDDRWRVNIVTEENIATELGTELLSWKRPHSFFLHFNHDTEEATYCNPPITKEY